MSKVKDVLFGEESRGPRTPPSPDHEYWNSQGRQVVNFIPSLPIDVAPHEFIALRLREAYEDGILAAKRELAMHDPRVGSMFAKKGRKP